MELVKQETALQIFNVTDAVLSDLESSTKLTIADAESEKVVRKYRQQAKSLQVQIEKRRLKLNREYKERTDKAAEILTARISPVYDDLDGKIKVVDAEREAKRLEREAAEKAEQERLEKIESERVAKIENAFAELESACRAGQEYNLPASEIKLFHHDLNNLEVSEDIFQERYQDAMAVWKKGLDDTHTALIAREKFEAEQADLEAKKKRLAEEQARFEAEQKAAIEAEAKKAQEQFEADWDAAIKYDKIWTEKKAAKKAEADRIWKAQEKLRLEREAFEKEKQAEEERKHAEAERIAEVEKYFVTIPGAIQERVNSPEQLQEYYEVLADLDIDENLFGDRLSEFKKLLEEKKAEIIDNLHGMAIKENAKFDSARKKKQRADKARAKLVKADKALLSGLLGKIKDPEFDRQKLKTDSARNVFDTFAENFDGMIHALRTDIDVMS